jgi:hypothetical protein
MTGITIMQTSNLHTVVIVAAFACWYLYFTARETARHKLDIYDLIMLSMVAIIPLAFVLFPGLALRVADVAGVGFPFVVMFGMLFGVLFIFIHRLTAKIHRLENDNRMLIQEVSILKASNSLVTDSSQKNPSRGPSVEG